MTEAQLEAKIISVLRREGFKFTTNRFFDKIIDLQKSDFHELNVTELSKLLHEELKL